ncbi:hypothetical protein NMY22_g6805 [Coprinellus aureogranulatus]|nr:hypothetical protein NMY22_g6805 [Coprinellus aureogranulatus]
MSSIIVPGITKLDLPPVEEYRQRKVALISGITGQDGSYLTEFLLAKGYQVHGIIRRSSSFNTGRLHHLYEDQHERPNKFKLHYGDLSDSTNLVYIIAQVQPTEVYNLGAQSHVKVSFEMAEYTGDVDGLGTLRLLDAIRTCGLEKHVRFYQASTSELYGKVVETPQSETTPFYPRSPYGCAKLYAYWICVNYRESYGMYACNGILFNHERNILQGLLNGAHQPHAGIRCCTGSNKMPVDADFEEKRRNGFLQFLGHGNWVGVDDVLAKQPTAAACWQFGSDGDDANRAMSTSGITASNQIRTLHSSTHISPQSVNALAHPQQWYNDEKEAISGGCKHEASCDYAHPSDKEWSRASRKQTASDRPPRKGERYGNERFARASTPPSLRALRDRRAEFSRGSESSRGYKRRDDKQKESSEFDEASWDVRPSKGKAPERTVTWGGSSSAGWDRPVETSGSFDIGTSKSSDTSDTAWGSTSGWGATSGWGDTDSSNDWAASSGWGTGDSSASTSTQVADAWGTGESSGTKKSSDTAAWGSAGGDSGGWAAPNAGSSSSGAGWGQSSSPQWNSTSPTIATSQSTQRPNKDVDLGNRKSVTPSQPTKKPSLTIAFGSRQSTIDDSQPTPDPRKLVSFAVPDVPVKTPIESKGKERAHERPSNLSIDTPANVPSDAKPKISILQAKLSPEERDAVYRKTIRYTQELVFIQVKLNKAKATELQWKRNQSSSHYAYSSLKTREKLEAGREAAAKASAELRKQRDFIIKELVTLPDIPTKPYRPYNVTADRQKIIAYTLELKEWMEELDLPRRVAALQIKEAQSSKPEMDGLQASTSAAARTVEEAPDAMVVDNPAVISKPSILQKLRSSQRVTLADINAALDTLQDSISLASDKVAFDVYIKEEMDEAVKNIRDKVMRKMKARKAKKLEAQKLRLKTAISDREEPMNTLTNALDEKFELASSVEKRIKELQDATDRVKQETAEIEKANDELEAMIVAAERRQQERANLIDTLSNEIRALAARRAQTKPRKERPYTIDDIPLDFRESLKEALFRELQPVLDGLMAGTTLAVEELKVALELMIQPLVEKTEAITKAVKDAPTPS